MRFYLQFCSFALWVVVTRQAFMSSGLAVEKLAAVAPQSLAGENLFPVRREAAKRSTVDYVYNVSDICTMEKDGREN